MDTITALWAQINSLGLHIHNHSNLIVTMIFDGEADSYFISIVKNNGEKVYTYTIEGISVKASTIIEFDMRQLINYLIELKRLKDEEV